MARRLSPLGASLWLLACGSSSGSSLFASTTNGIGGRTSLPGSGGVAQVASGGFGGSFQNGAGGAAGGVAGGAAGGAPFFGGAAGAIFQGNGGAGPGAGGAQPSKDAGSPPPEDGGTSRATPGSIFCAGTQCTIAGVPTNTCCVGAVPFPTSCLPSFPGCVNGGIMAISCDDAADCQGSAVCCGNLSGQNPGTRCTTTCSSPQLQVCRTSAECHAGRCLPMPQSPNYGACQ